MIKKKIFYLYESRKKIHPSIVDGFLSRLRNLSLSLFLFIYFLLPWLNYNGRQAVLLDLINRKFCFYNFIFWPQDFYLLAFLLIILAFGLFAFTVYLGRIWCGYICPQTAWVYFFMYIERLIEGDYNRIVKLNNEKINLKKFFKKFFKIFLWIFLSFITSFTFIGYFTPINDLFYLIVNKPIDSWVNILIIFFTITTYFNAGWLREQVCFYMCPYARFQSVMLDNNTITVCYDYNRGEPRGKYIKNETRIIGDCINCLKCVSVCPTGIDIRNGFQMECINCGACVDACNYVMEKISFKNGLIRYTSENDLKGEKNNILRFQLVGYFLLLLLFVFLFLYSFITRIEFDVNIYRDRNNLYYEIDNNIICNDYFVKITNMSNFKKTYKIEVIDNECFNYLENKITFIPSGDLLLLSIQIQKKIEYINNNKTNIYFKISDLSNKKSIKFVKSVFIYNKI